MVEHLLSSFTALQTRLYTRLIASAFSKVGPGARISPPFRFSGLRYVSLGSNVKIHKDCWILTINQSNQLKHPKLVIESGAQIGQGATVSAGLRIEIGEGVLLARNVYISDHSHAFDRIDLPISDQGITDPKPVKIGPGSWLGQNVCILPGVDIGKNCVIGANSVVKSSIPDYSVAAGAPARVIRRFDGESKLWLKVSR